MNLCINLLVTISCHLTSICTSNKMTKYMITMPVKRVISISDITALLCTHLLLKSMDLICGTPLNQPSKNLKLCFFQKPIKDIAIIVCFIYQVMLLCVLTIVILLNHLYRNIFVYFALCTIFLSILLLKFCIKPLLFMLLHQFSLNLSINFILINMLSLPL